MPHILDLEKQFEKWWREYGEKYFPGLPYHRARETYIRTRMEWEAYRKYRKGKKHDQANGE